MLPYLQLVLRVLSHRKRLHAMQVEAWRVGTEARRRTRYLRAARDCAALGLVASGQVVKVNRGAFGVLDSGLLH